MTASEKGLDAVVRVVVERALLEGLLATNLDDGIVVRATQTTLGRAALDAAGFPMYLTPRQTTVVLRAAAIRLTKLVS